MTRNNYVSEQQLDPTESCPTVASADGEHGRDVTIVRSAEEAASSMRMESDLRQGMMGADQAGESFSLAGPNHATRQAASWVLQELVPGCVEFATSLLMSGGRVFDLVCTRYTYTREQYVWPRAEEVQGSRRHFDAVPMAHLDVMTKLLGGYSGIANFN